MYGFLENNSINQLDLLGNTVANSTIKGKKTRVGTQKQKRDYAWGLPPSLGFSWADNGSTWNEWKGGSSDSSLPSGCKWVSGETETGAGSTSYGDWELDNQSVSNRHRKQVESQEWERTVCCES